MITSLAKAAVLATSFVLPAFGQGSEVSERGVLDHEALPVSLSEESLDQIKMLSEDHLTKVYTQEADDAFWARGRTYKSSFAAGGTTYYPLLGPDQPRLYGFSLQSPTLAVGGKEITLDGEAAPQGSEAEVRYERGPMIEWYRLGVESIEQLFTFDAPLGSGALTVTIPVETELQPEAQNGGFYFRNEAGGVHYGAATVLDAAGKVERAVTRWTGSSLQIEVSESFLAGAQWPVTIDPLITSGILDDFSSELTRPDISYDLTTDRIIVVYQEWTSTTDRDIYWRMFNRSDLTLLDGDYWEFTTDDWFRPRVANNNFSDSFLVVAEKLLAGGFHQISYRIIEAATGDQGQLWGLSSIEFVSNETPDVGGEVVLVSDSYWLVVWIERDVNGNERVVCTRVNSAGVCLFDDIRLYTGPLNATTPAVANTAGSQGRFNVVYAAGELSSRQIRGATVSWSGATLHADHLIADLPGRLSAPAVTADLQSAGGRYLVVYDRFESGLGTDIMATVCDGAGPLFNQDLTEQGGVNLGATRGSAEVDHDGERFAVVWTDRTGASNTDVFASTFALAGDNLCESESRVLLGCGGGMGFHGNSSIVSLASGGGTTGSTYAAWECSQSSSNIYGGHYRLDPTDCVSRAYCNPAVPNSTGEFGRLRVRGSHLASAGAVIMQADQLPNFQFGFFICATGTNSFIPPGSNGRLCLGGTLGRFLGPGQVQSTGSNGGFSLGVSTAAMPTTPAQAVLPGQTWFFQAWHRDTVGAGSNFTRAGAVQFD